jgi:hypothetical protein
MSVPLDFYGPFLKAERAKHHIDELQAIFNAYIAKNRQTFIRKTKAKNKSKAVSFGGKFPRHTSTVIGDAVHNMRAALDHAYIICVEANGKTPGSHTHFPVGGDLQSLKGSIKGHVLKDITPTQAVLDAIVELIQPYPGGDGEDIHRLNILDRSDKHTVLIPTMSKVTIRNYIASITNGPQIFFDTTLSTMGPNFQNDALINFGSGVVFHAQKDANVAFEICFDQGQPFEAQEVLAVLRRLLVSTNGALEVLRTA